MLLTYQKVAMACSLGLYLFSSVASGQVSAQLQASRTEGVAPLAVYFETTASGAEYPFHQLHYKWTFDDDGADVWTHTGKSKNIATGPAAAHIFEHPGVYTVELQVRDAEGNLTSDSVSITVDDPNSYYSGSKTVCFSVAGDFSGAPTGCDLRHLPSGDFSNVIQEVSTGKRILLKRGETFSAGSHSATADGPITIGAFGPGSTRPIINSSGGRILKIGGNDWRITDLEFRGAGDQSSGIISASTKSNLTNFLFMNNTATPGTLHSGAGLGGSHLAYWGLPIHENIFFAGNELQDFGFGAGGNIFYIAARRLAVLGNTLEDSTDGEHIIRLPHVDKFVLSHNRLANQRDTKHLLTVRQHNLDSCSPDCGDSKVEGVIADNIMLSQDDWPLQVIGKNSPDHRVYGEDIIIERNFIAGMETANSGTQAGVESSFSRYVTIRNNIFRMNDWQARTAISTSSDDVWIYNSTAYTSNSANSATVVRIGTDEDDGSVASNVQVRNNLLYAPNVSSTSIVSGNSAATASSNLIAETNPFAVPSPFAPKDFQLASTGAAVDAGGAVPVLVDYALGQRPAGAGWDIGAFESGSSGNDGGGSDPISGNLISYGGFDGSALEDMPDPYVLGTHATDVWMARLGTCSQCSEILTDGSDAYLAAGSGTTNGTFQVVQWPGSGTLELSFEHKGGPEVRILGGHSGDTIGKWFDDYTPDVLYSAILPSQSTWTTESVSIELAGSYDYLVVQFIHGDIDDVSTSSETAGDAAQQVLSLGEFDGSALEDMPDPYVLGTHATDVWMARLGTCSQCSEILTDGSDAYLAAGSGTTNGAFQVVQWPGSGTLELSFKHKGGPEVRILGGHSGDTIGKWFDDYTPDLLYSTTLPSQSTWTTESISVELAGSYDYLVVQFIHGDIDSASAMYQ